jgi:hypothetical protein
MYINKCTYIFIQSQLHEEERLAATLWRIEQDAVIIPRGAYVLQPNGDVERNRTFQGNQSKGL